MKLSGIALLLIFVAALIFLLSYRQRKASGLPGGQIVYSDSGLWQEVVEPYYDSHLQLAGKPDYVIKQGYTHIPVEVKTGRTPEAPYDSHIFQLAAYCYLIDRETGLRPPYGVLQYPRQTFKIAYSEEMEASLLTLIGEIRKRDKGKDGVPRSHNSSSRCRSCGYRSICDQRLG
ncbi:MAG: CRISPR-associated protein Cas4 [Anaerolineaceae bacterium]|nr:CRISPR-associated protein Cas4 [Anaerolineaceae bacterium]